MFKILVIILSYFIGNITSAYFVAKWMANIDIREYGSKNAGATNILRTLGWKAALLTLFLDLLKGVIAVKLGLWFSGGNNLIPLLCGIAVVAGHNWPIFFGFKGGKGIATSLGVILTISPFISLITILIGVIIIAVTRYVSLASISGAFVYPMLMLIFGKPIEEIIFALVLGAMAIVKHKQNIERLLKGTESKIGNKTKIK